MLARKKKNNVKSADEILLDNRFTDSKDFYIDYINSQMDRDSYEADAQYLQILSDKAWLIGYEYGYAAGKMFMSRHYKMFE